MATGGAPPEGLLSSGGKVSGKLLSHVASHLDPMKQEQFALEVLELEPNVLRFIQKDFPVTSQRRNSEILDAWYKKTSLDMTVGPFLDNLVAWQQAGYFDRKIWSDLPRIVSPELITRTISGGENRPHSTTPGDNVLQLDTSATREKVKRHLKAELAKCLSNDWLDPEEDEKMDLMQIYTETKWSLRINKGIHTEWEPKSSVFDILPSESDGDEPKKILVEAIAGMGKTSTMAFLALNWAEENKKISFRFVFLIPLREVNENIPLPELIKIHHGLEETPTSLVESILAGETHDKVLIILDGYDEYTRGNNKAIDDAIEKHVNSFSLLITSRPGKDPKDETYIKKTVRDKMNNQVMIQGFTDESIYKCSALFLGSKEQSQAMLEQVLEKSKRHRFSAKGLWELLRTPITLLMICVLFSRNKSLPNSRTEIYEQIRTLSMNRTTIKSMGKQSEEIENLEELLNGLGELAWKALRNDQLLLKKRDIKDKHKDILKLGLLHEVGGESATIKKKEIFVSFQHKTLQEFSAAEFTAKSVERSEDPEETLKQRFPSIEAVWKQMEVVGFCVGLMSDPTPLIAHIYEMKLEDIMDEIRSYSFRVSVINEELFDTLYRESRGRLPGTAFHNPWINWYKPKKGDRENKTPVYVPSRFYMFDGLKEDVECHIAENDAEIPECVVCICDPTEAVTDCLVQTCQTICQKQNLSNLCLFRLSCTNMSTDVFRLSPNAQSVFLYECHLPPDVIKNLLHQLSHCTQLTRLGLWRIHVGGLLPKFTPDTPLQSLEKLKLEYTDMNKDDVCHIANLIRTNKLPGLKELNLSSNTLTGLLPEFTPDTPLQSLEKLRLGFTRMNKDDICHIAHLINKLPGLNDLDLSGNTLTGLLPEFTLDTPLQSLEKLDLAYNDMNKDDICHIAHLIRTNKLPRLRYLILSQSLCDMEGEVGELMEAACLTHYHLSKRIMENGIYDLLDIY